MLELLPAKPVVEPTWWACPEYAYSLGQEVAEVSALAGFAPDAEQELLLEGIFAVAENGKAAAFEVDLFGPRQNFKTGTIAQSILGWLFVLDLPDVIYSAQTLDGAEQCWSLVASLIEDTPALSKLLKPTRGERPGITEGKGSWAIDLKTGQSAMFRTRGAHTGRALRAARVVLDEGYAVTPTHIGGMLPVLTALPDPQYVLASSAGKVDSTVAIDARDRGRGGGTYRQMYAEYGDIDAVDGRVPCEQGERCTHAKPPNNPPGCALDDEERWARIMPALGGRVQVETIRGMRLSMPPEEFARECLVWWDVDGSDAPPATLDRDQWNDLRVTDAPAPTQVAVMIDVSPDLKHSTVSICGDGANHPLVLVKRDEGTGWVVPYLQQLMKRSADESDQRQHEVLEVALNPSTKASVLLKALADAGIDVREMTNAEAGQACAAFQVAVTDGELEHVGQADLDAAVANAYVRWSGEADLWDRRNRAIDISPVVSGSGAYWRWTQIGSGSGFNIW